MSTSILGVGYRGVVDSALLAPSSSSEGQLVAWLASQIPDASDVRLEDVATVDIGHSAETILLTVVWRTAAGEERCNAVLRLTPRGPGLLPPYDLQRQVTVLRCLEGTAVRAPKVLWHDPTGTVLGREFYVMERVAGVAFEVDIPDDVANDPALARAQSFAFIDELAAIHNVDLVSAGLADLADGRHHLERELDHWESEIRRLQRGSLPALERLVEVLRERQPAQSDRVTLVHGDAKPGNVLFVGSEVAAILDWELTSVGDPQTDIGWLELMWAFPVGLPTVPGAPTIEEVLERYTVLTGITLEHRSWHRGLQGLKMAVINLSGSMLLDEGRTDDPKMVVLGHAVHYLTLMALHEMGIDEDLPSGPVTPRPERVEYVMTKAQQ